jgi:hypothetical protein
MTGPFAETSRLYTRVELAAAHWQLELWADPAGQAYVECMECGSGQLLKAAFRGKPFTVLDLAALIEAHLPRCYGASTQEPAAVAEHV